MRGLLRVHAPPPRSPHPAFPRLNGNHPWPHATFTSPPPGHRLGILVTKLLPPRSCPPAFARPMPARMSAWIRSPMTPAPRGRHPLTGLRPPWRSLEAPEAVPVFDRAAVRGREGGASTDGGGASADGGVDPRERGEREGNAQGVPHFRSLTGIFGRHLFRKYFPSMPSSGTKSLNSLHPT